MNRCIFLKKVFWTLPSLREAENDMGCEFEADFYESPGPEIIVFLEYTSGFPQLYCQFCNSAEYPTGRI